MVWQKLVVNIGKDVQGNSSRCVGPISELRDSSYDCFCRWAMLEVISYAQNGQPNMHLFTATITMHPSGTYRQHFRKLASSPISCKVRRRGAFHR